MLIGNIIITKDIIKITNNDLTNEYLISNLRNIKITFYGSEGSEYKNNPYSMVYKEGANNYLEFEELNGKKYIYEIYVENEGKLRQAILTMENRHIPFKLVNKA